MRVAFVDHALMLDCQQSHGSINTLGDARELFDQENSRRAGSSAGQTFDWQWLPAFLVQAPRDLHRGLVLHPHQYRAIREQREGHAVALLHV